MEDGIKTVFSQEGQEIFEIAHDIPGDNNSFEAENQIELASPVSIMKKHLLHELRFRDEFLKTAPVDQITEKVDQGFASTINVIQRVVITIRLHGWNAIDHNYFLTDGTEMNFFGDDILPSLGIKVLQFSAPTARQNSNFCEI